MKKTKLETEKTELPNIYFEEHRENYEEQYLERTKTEEDPRGLVGPKNSFQEMREWQANLLIELGLKPWHKVLDFGCGVLRAGIPLIDYLEKGNYIGSDISLKTLIYGHEAIHRNNLGHKAPIIVNNEGVSFDKLKDFSVDYLMIQSVWTHLPPDRLKKFVENMDHVLKEESTAVATMYPFRESGKVEHDPHEVDWTYPESHVYTLLDDNDFEAQILQVKHPNNLTTLEIKKKKDP